MHFLGFTSDLAASSEVRALEGRVEDGLPMASCRLSPLCASVNCEDAHPDFLE